MALQKWTWPSNYMGERWDEYYVFLGRNRDSDCLTNSNFRSALSAIGGETDTVKVVSENHWACGWIEWIAIHESDTAALETANRIADKLEDYPVVDEEDWSNLEWETAAEYWAGMSIRERVEWCQRYGCSIFAARREDIPDDPTGELVSALAA